jgi:hypothetical protein
MTRAQIIRAIDDATATGLFTKVAEIPRPPRKKACIERVVAAYDSSLHGLMTLVVHISREAPECYRLLMFIENAGRTLSRKMGCKITHSSHGSDKQPGYHILALEPIEE